MSDKRNEIIKELIAGISDAAATLDEYMHENKTSSALWTIKKNCAEIVSLLEMEEADMREAKAPKECSLFIDEVTAIIGSNIGDFDFDANRLADMMNTSLVTLNRKIKRATGCNTTIYIRRLKLEKAKYLLESSDLTIMEIQEACGFDMQSYFSRTFKELFGMSPLKYRTGRKKL